MNAFRHIKLSIIKRDCQKLRTIIFVTPLFFRRFRWKLAGFWVLAGSFIKICHKFFHTYEVRHTSSILWKYQIIRKFLGDTKSLWKNQSIIVGHFENSLVMSLMVQMIWFFHSMFWMCYTYYVWNNFWQMIGLLLENRPLFTSNV